MRTKGIFTGVTLLLISTLPLMYYMAGNHGHLMFRPHMEEDWVPWGLFSFFAVLGVLALFISITAKRD